MPAGSAHLVDIVKGDDISRGDRGPRCVGVDADSLQHPADAHVPRNDRIGYAGELAMMQVYVGAADLARYRLQEDSTLFQGRVIE